MRFLADAGISPKTVDFLKRLGHEAIHVRALELQRASDAQVVPRALSDGSIVLSFDFDFGDVLALGVMDKPSTILFRLADERAESVRAAHNDIERADYRARVRRADPRRGHAVSRQEAADPPGVMLRRERLT